jgi:hypothetical protein
MYLLINEISPEPGLSSLVRIRWQQRTPVVPDLVNVLNDDEGFTDRFTVVDENRDLLVNRVHLETQLALVPQVLLLVLVLDPLLSQRDPHPHPKEAGPETQQNNLVRHFSQSNTWSAGPQRKIKDQNKASMRRWVFVCRSLAAFKGLKL